jgi:hypothetical protein
MGKEREICKELNVTMDKLVPINGSQNNSKVVTFEKIIPHLLPHGYRLELHEETRIISILDTVNPHIIAQQQLTKNEWSIFLTLLSSYPHYAPYEALMASITDLSIDDCRIRLLKAQQDDAEALKRELKPVHRALSGIRAKLNSLSPHLKVSIVRNLGYSLITAME